jgi:hypothetical protein
MLNEYKDVFVSYLNRLQREITSYKNETDLWKTVEGISNPPGNLYLHLCGNLQHYFGALLGKSGYIRNRDLEFSRKNVPLQELLKEINTTISSVSAAFDKLNEKDLWNIYPDKTFGENVSSNYVILECAVHFGYHLGQINYHRRILGI